MQKAQIHFERRQVARNKAQTGGFGLSPIFGMNQREPVGQTRRRSGFRIPQHARPLRGTLHAISRDIPLPQSFTANTIQDLAARTLALVIKTLRSLSALQRNRPFLRLV